jgi:hypothetical protein
LYHIEAINYSLFVERRKPGKYGGYSLCSSHLTLDGAAVVLDALGEWEYKFTIPDFFISTKMARTKAMRFGIRMLGHGDMTITTKVLACPPLVR